MEIELQGELLQLLPQKAIHWDRTSTLVLSDLHLGKAGHFRKHGIPIPQKVHFDDLVNMTGLIEKHNPKRIIFLGDLFHSDLNAEWWAFIDWLKHYPALNFILVKGNHDIIPEILFTHARINFVENLEEGPFFFTHMREEHPTLYNLSGHIHPGAHLFGSGKQGLILPCFQFCGSYGLLPAFGNFTGLAKVRPKSDDRVFVVADDRVIDVTR